MVALEAARRGAAVLASDFAQLIGSAPDRVVPGLPRPPPPPWAPLGEPTGLGEALQAAGFIDVEVHEVTRHQSIADGHGRVELSGSTRRWPPAVRRGRR